jgi:hypothetical protein
MNDVTWTTPSKYLAARYAAHTSQDIDFSLLVDSSFFLSPRTALIYFVKDLTTKLGIKYANIPQPIVILDPKQWEELKKKQ